MKLSGLVAILSDDGLSIAEIRDLGPEPVDVKPGRVVPLIDTHPVLKSGEKEGTETIVLNGDHADRTWSVVALYSGADVDVERERRIALPLGVNLPSGSFRINMDPESQRNIQGLSTAGILLSSAAPGQKTTFRDYDNVNHDLLPSDLIQMGLQVMARIQAVYQKAWALKAISPIPADYADDSHW